MEGWSKNLSAALGFGGAEAEAKEEEPPKKPGTRSRLEPGEGLVAFDNYAPARKPRIVVTNPEQVDTPEPAADEEAEVEARAEDPQQIEANPEEEVEGAAEPEVEGVVEAEVAGGIEGELQPTDGSINESNASTFQGWDDSQIGPTDGPLNEASLELEGNEDLVEPIPQFPGEQYPPQFYNPNLFLEPSDSDSSSDEERGNNLGIMAPNDATPEYTALKALIQSHVENVKTIYGRVKAIKDDIEKLATVQSYLDSLTALAAKLLSAKESVFSLTCSEEQRTALLLLFGKPDDQILDCRTWARLLKERSDEASKPINQSSPFAYQKRTLVKFSGDNADDYERFITEFHSMISQFSKNQSITDLERFTVLRDHTTGQANRAIKNLTNRNESFKQALDILDKLFNKPIQRVSNCYNKVLLCKKATGYNNGYNAKELQRVHTAYYNCTRTMETMGVDPEENAGWLYTKARQDFPSKIIADFDDFHADKISPTAKHGTTCKFSAFLDFVLSRLKSQFSSEANEEHENRQGGNRKVNNARNGNKNQGGQTKSKTTCNLCGANHASIKCNKWKMLQAKQMIDLLKQKKLCMICGEKHFSRECTKSPCFKCGKQHNTNICLTNDQKKPNKNNKKSKNDRKRTNKISTVEPELPENPEPEEEPTEESKDQPGQLIPYQGKTNKLARYSLISKISSKKHTILDTLICYAIFTDKNGATFQRRVRIFLDTGSEINLITRKVAEKAAAKPTVAKLEMTAGIEHKSNEKLVSFQLKSLDGEYVSRKIYATTLATVTKPFRAIDVHPSKYHHLKDITFTEPYPTKELQIDMLLGNEVCALIATATAKIGKPTEPIAKKTKLGWVLSGIY